MAEDKKQLHIEVRNKIAKLTSNNFQLVGGNSDYKVVFDFDEDWAEHNIKTALFVFGKSSVAKVFEGNICNGIEINNATTCYIGVFSGNIITTTPAEVTDILQSITDIGGVPQDPTESVYNQIIELLNKYIEQGGGESGFSPTIDIVPIENGHRLTITDINGSKSFDILNGDDGTDGYTPQKGIDYFTESDKKEIISEVKSEIIMSNGSKLYRHDIMLWAGYMNYIFEICFSYYSNDATPRTLSVVDDENYDWKYDAEGNPLQITLTDIDFIPTGGVTPATGYFDDSAQTSPILVTGIEKNGNDLKIAGYRTDEEFWYKSYSRFVYPCPIADIEKIIDNVTEIVLSPLENGDEVAY